MIRYSTQCIDDDDIRAVTEALRSDYLTQGPRTDAFEKKIASYVDSKHAVAVNSATSALHLACLALGLTKGSLAWTSPNSFAASSNCALYCGADVDFVDIDPQTYNISITALKEKLQQAKSKGRLPQVLIAVHFAGQSCDMKSIHALSKEYGFKIIEDASHALGAQYNGKKVGSCEFSNISVLSFHPVKMITTGEGGMLTTNDPKLFETLISLRSHGMVRDSSKLKYPADGPWYHEQQHLGFNYRMTEIQAALGLSQMEKLDRFTRRRREIAEVYDKELKGLPLQLPTEIKDSRMSYHLYVIRMKQGANQKADIFKKMKDKGIEVQVHYIPIYRHPYYRDMGFTLDQFPNMEKYYQEALSIPNHPKLTPEDQQKVMGALKEIMS